MNSLFNPIQSNKVDFINKELDKSIKHLEYCNTLESDLVRAIDYCIMESVDDRVQDSVAKAFREEKLPNKEVVRRVKRLWS